MPRRYREELSRALSCRIVLGHPALGHRLGGRISPGPATVERADPADRARRLRYRLNAPGGS